ncbi:hypothetical protein HRbin29_01373 [bacterium HR29]|nr:hypothetical protein HRbin29_01373 [bacterium HR29]
MAAEQRFCPMCDEAFIEGDAVLRCTGCGVLYHPRCWVRQDGCTTPGEHPRTPIALAYSLAPAAPRPAVADTPRAEASKGEPPSASQGAEEGAEAVVGATPARPSLEQGPPSTAAPRPQPLTIPYATRNRFRRGNPPNLAVYERHRWARYWYLPASAVLAALTALAVIIVGERLLDGGSGSPPAATATAASQGEANTPVPDATATPPGVTPTAATPTGRFVVGQRLRVTGTGECLNLRALPSLQGDVVACLPDGTEVEVRGGPREADGYAWWQLATPQGDGWAVEDYLAPLP